QLQAEAPDLKWIKLDLDELGKLATSTATTTPDLLEQHPELKSQISQIWDGNRPFNVADYLKRETLNGQPVYHLQVQIKNDVLAHDLTESISLVKNAESGATLTDIEKSELEAVLGKFQAKAFDLWLGRKDYQLYKIHFALAAPSVADFNDQNLIDAAIPAVGTARAKSRDAKRFADIRQISSALELYANDHGGYPAGDHGQPAGAVPDYIGVFPQAPLPADGTCTDYYNGYWYEPAGKAATINGRQVYPSYSLTFCLGGDTGGLAAGIGELTPQGLKGNIACPSTLDLCLKNTAGQTADLTQQINQLKFGGEITWDATFADYGKPVTATAPASSTDVSELIKAFNGSAGTSY
ncbi:MAG TPA: hypothetical protein VHA30_02045, partial [Patescibacteria group bacterium]|nr:hypothetical protein [Patescibacteria group bacterium]